MIVIGFFQDLFSSLSGLVNFVTVPLGEQFSELSQFELIANSSIIGLFGVGVVATLGTLLIFHLIRLFVGG